MLKGKTRKIVLITILAGSAVWLVSSAIVAWMFTHRLGSPYAESAPHVTWGKLETLRFKTSDNQELGAYLARGDGHKGCVLLLHGQGSSRHEMLPVMQWLAEADFNALAISLRGHGDSTGQTHDFGWSERLDVIAAVRFLQKEFPQQPIFIEGRSLGAAAAIFAAGELKGEIAGYFLEQPYKDLGSAVWIRLRHQLPPVLDWIAYCGLRLWAPVFLPVDVDQISPYERVRDIPESVPIVFASGTADRHARSEDVVAIYDRVESHAKLVEFKDAAHVGLDRFDPQLYRTTLFDFLAERPSKASGP
jgi:uncharacterized protein